ncbi:MAG: TetR/AcrR family transcriptional regulator [Planctomycetaceae bacterium]
MSVLSAKQQEIQDRERHILAAARQQVDARGYLGLSMDSLAADVGYSKGTIYNHFPNKEEVLLALAIETQQKQSTMFRKAAAYTGASRQRIVAIGVADELFVRLYPQHFQIEQVVFVSSIWEKTSEKRRFEMRAGQQACMGVIAGIVRDAVASGDLSLPENTTPEDVVFSLWSMSFGAHSIIAQSGSLTELGIEDPFETLRHGTNHALDGFGWKPFSTEVDYLSLFDTVPEELFADELKVHRERSRRGRK